MNNFINIILAPKFCLVSYAIWYLELSLILFNSEGKIHTKKPLICNQIWLLSNTSKPFRPPKSICVSRRNMKKKFRFSSKRTYEPLQNIDRSTSTYHWIFFVDFCSWRFLEIALRWKRRNERPAMHRKLHRISSVGWQSDGRAFESGPDRVGPFSCAQGLNQLCSYRLFWHIYYNYYYCSKTFCCSHVSEIPRIFCEKTCCWYVVLQFINKSLWTQCHYEEKFSYWKDLLLLLGKLYSMFCFGTWNQGLWIYNIEHL